jgi:hypothetical protein
VRPLRMGTSPLPRGRRRNTPHRGMGRDLFSEGVRHEAGPAAARVSRPRPGSPGLAAPASARGSFLFLKRTRGCGKGPPHRVLAPPQILFRGARRAPLRPGLSLPRANPGCPAGASPVRLERPPSEELRFLGEDRASFCSGGTLAVRAPWYGPSPVPQAFPSTRPVLVASRAWTAEHPGVRPPGRAHRAP